MHSSFHPLHKLWVGLVTAVCATSLGCAHRESVTPLTCRVLIDGLAALEVRLVLMRVDHSELKPVLEGVSDPSGVIALKWVEDARLPSDTELELVVMVESIGSGDWQLNSPWSDPKKSPLKVKWPSGSDHIDIPLPKKAIRAI